MRFRQLANALDVSQITAAYLDVAHPRLIPAIRMIEPLISDWGQGVGRARLVCDDQPYTAGFRCRALAMTP